MDSHAVRVAFFLTGLFTLLSWELAAPHHHPTAPRLRRWAGNLSLAAMNGVVISVLCATCYAIAAANAAPWRYGPFQQLVALAWLRLPLEIAVLDLAVYALHRAYHRIPGLWRFHQVHHSDLDLDVTSASRFHLGEVLVSAGGKFVSVLALGISPMGLVSFETLMLLAAQFQHANIRLSPSLERVLWWTFVPPAMHRVHHHPVRNELDSNFGTLLTVWDRIFRTMHRPESDAGWFGLPGVERETAMSLTSLLGLPFRPPTSQGPT